MKHEITISIAPEADRKKESAKLSLHYAGQREEVALDLDGNALLGISRTIPDLAQDFLCIASCIYATDKALPRHAEDDKWTRHLAVEIPVEHVETWTSVAEDLSGCITFLTGDKWELSFRHNERRLIQKRPRKRFAPFRRIRGPTVGLFSGGLDSFIGAVDWMTANPEENLLLVGHYDGDVGGPCKDQTELAAALQQRFRNRFLLSQTRVGLSSGSNDTNFRSRSLLFIALGCYFAELFGEEVPILIPENGPIALNFPLTPARRGSCSTRTVHPFFIGELNRILLRVGMVNSISNPYAFKTKGEMVAECLDQAFLFSTCNLTRSCAKLGHPRWWTNRRARACGACIPCLFRRASLHLSGLDLEVYGKPIEEMNSLDSTASDVLALVSFLRSQYSDREIAAGLLAQGPLPMDDLRSYVNVVQRMRAEVLVWMRARGSRFIQNELRAC